jgi:hypothetical protein
VEAAALLCLASSAPERALTPAVERLEAADPAMRLAAGRALGTIGPPALPFVLEALSHPATAAAGVEAARRLDAVGSADLIRTFVVAAAERARTDRELVAATPEAPELEALLRAAILDRARGDARSALWAASMVAADREAHGSAIERLDASGPVRATALETLEAVDAMKVVGPLLALWEPIPASMDDDGRWLARALDDETDFVRRCAVAVRARREGDIQMRSVETVSVIERVLLLRRIPLFADLRPEDLERLAGIAEEQGYDEGETIAREGEVGDAMHIITEGTIAVVGAPDGHVIATRSAGDVVGEMSIITKEPRMASLVAESPVRTIRIGQRAFESMVRERPDLALGVMRVLALRLAESARPGPTSPTAT